MNLFYATLLLLLLGTYAIVLRRIKKSFDILTPFLGWMVGLGYFLIVPLVILTLHGGFKFPAMYEMNGSWGEVNLSRTEFFRPYIYIWVSLMLTCAAAYFSCPSRAENGKQKSLLSRSKLERALLLTMSLTLADWAVMVWLNGGLEEFLLSHWYLREGALIERFGSAYVLFMHASLVIQVLFTGAAALYAGAGLRERKTRRGFTSLIVLFLLGQVVMSGNRIFFAMYLLAFASSCWLYNRKRILYVMLMAAPMIVVVFSAWTSVRHDLSKLSDSVSTYMADADRGDPVVTRLMEVTEGANVMLLLHMINDFGNQFDYLYGSTYSRLLTVFRSRKIHPDRTPNFTTIAADLYEPGEETSLNSTALGEAIANFGFVGIFVLPVFTWAVARYTNWLASASGKHALLSAVSFLMLIWFARSTFAENAMTLIGAALLIRVFALDNDLSPAESQQPAGEVPGGPACWT